jgi:ribonuclease HI
MTEQEIGLLAAAIAARLFRGFGGVRAHLVLHAADERELARMDEATTRDFIAKRLLALSPRGDPDGALLARGDSGAPDGALLPVFYIDGGCSANGQRDMSRRSMVMVVTDQTGTVLCERHEDGGSNNIAELKAAVAAIAWARAHGIPAAEIRSDSKVCIGWINRMRPGREMNDREAVVRLLNDAAKLRATVKARFVWVPRSRNLAGHYIERKYHL